MSLELQATTVRARNRERPTVMLSDLDAAAADGSVTLEVRDGPMDGQALVGRFARIKIGRNPGNDLELHSDRSVSSDHAVLRQDEEGGGWVVEDLRSTNGTWIDGRRLNPGEPAAIDGEFMVGHTVLRLVPGVAGGESFLPDAAALRDETSRLAAGFATETAEGYGAALAQASAELKPFLSDRHFFLGLLAMNPGLAVLARNQGPIPSRFLTETLRRNEYWSGPQAWINRQLRALAIEVASVFKDELVATPRLLRLLLAAAEGARAAGSKVVRPDDVLQAYFAGPGNRPRDLLARDGIEPESLLPLLGKGAARKRPEPTKEQAIAVPPALRRRRRSPPAIPGSTPAPRRWPAASTASRRSTSSPPPTTAATPCGSSWSRRSPRSRGTAGRACSARSSASSRSPSARCPTSRWCRRTARGRSRSPRSEAPALPLPGGVPWRAVLESKGREEALAGLGAEERAAADLFADLYAFSTALERFIVSIVQNLRSPGVGTETLQLPGARTSILRHSRELLAGKAPRPEALKEYLAAVETWLVAAVAAYHEGPDLWFKDFWRRASPAAIESPLAEENKKKRLGFGIDSLEFWNRYKERVRTVSPDLVSDEILHIVRRRVDEQYNQLCERRKP